MDAITKGYDGEPLFKRLSMTVEAGERIAIIGPNGIGKTTLLKTLAGELHPDAGEVKWTEAAEVGVLPKITAMTLPSMPRCLSGCRAGPPAVSR
ncbi:hypothetical protein HSBAA_59850 [Vreelandella sulfidaeris]|uniref:ABC transporter domain-containing protein n=1 Tax=Vreelandella sulfidaeris TaxID=115553 RepID=A0A455UKB7_9GAMM|nr:hypothetical protein HSBAA_59850 [Halomonas sulfidaeris]